MKKITYRKITLFVTATFLLMTNFNVELCVAQVGPSVIRIKPTVDWNMSGGDDMAKLKKLASGVGSEFAQNEKTIEALKRIGINRLRLINVPLTGTFDSNGKFIPAGDSHLDANLEICRAAGAKPHIILVNLLIEELRVKAKDIKTDDKRTLGLLRQKVFGPNDWAKFRSWIKAHFQYVLVDKGFSEAVFEVGNEPDIGGAFVAKPPSPGIGSREMFDAYFKLYSNISQIATEFEMKNPGVKVTLGGPALAGPFTFRFGDFNWMERFLYLVNEKKLKLDFIGFHFYGNVAPLTGESYNHTFPNFSKIMQNIRQWRDKYTPEVPICLTEWGASYHVNSTSESINANASHIGASFSAAFLNQMLIEGVDESMYLVTTDFVKNGDKNIWGWCSLFTSPSSSVGFHPKAPYHVFQMVKQMEDKRIESTHPGRYVDCIASCGDNGKLTIMVWNHSYRIDEFGLGVEQGQKEAVNLCIFEADNFFGGPVRMKRWLVSETVSNALYFFQKGETIDKRAELQLVDTGEFTPVDNALDIGFALPPSSVAFIEIMPVNNNNKGKINGKKVRN